MISRFSKSATPFCPDEETGLHPASSGDARGSDREGMLCGTAKEYAIGQQQNHPKGISLRTVCLWAALVFVPAVLVASWFQFRVVGGLESELTATQARNLAAKMDAVIDARSSALRMAAGSIEIENLAASGGLNRLLGGLKDLFPDFRSLEILTEQGQPLAMMGELSLEHVGKRSGLLKSSNQESGLSSEPLFRDTPASDCFFLTMKHQGTDGVMWFSRARFSREAVTSVLEPQRADRNARLVSAHAQTAGAAQPVSGPRVVPLASESDPKGSSEWGTRSFSARVPLETPQWTVTLERKVPVSMVYYLSLVMGGILVAGSGIFLFLSRKSGNAPGTIHAASVSEMTDMAQAQDEKDSALPDTSDRDPDVSEAFAEALALEAGVDADEGESGDIALKIGEPEEFGPALAQSPSATEDDAFHADTAPTADEELCDPFFGLEEELDLGDERAQIAAASPQDGGEVSVREGIAAKPAEPMAGESMLLIDAEGENSIIVGEPIQQDSIPETLEVCWTESPEEEARPVEQSSVTVVNRWYSGV